MIRVLIRVVRNPIVRFGRKIAAAGALLALAVAVSVGMSAWQENGVPDGWGADALVADTPVWSPIHAANACGMGASSCFKCHNGSRAVAPTQDRQQAPWHVEHKAVNQSCSGCHRGNARLIKKELAHKDLVQDPRTETATCATCHKGGNVAELVKMYQR